MGSMSAALQLLTLRLEWPASRVRWEAAHELARLIAQGAAGAAEALLSWISSRDLESEAALGVSIIHAFDLGRHFDVADVVAVIRSPSLLSDQLLRASFPGTSVPSATYGYAMGSWLVEREDKSYFDRNLGQVIALRYRSRLQSLEARSGFPFLLRWFAEWNWLRRRYDLPLSGRPDYIWADGPRDNTSNVQVRQTEAYVSAYLRTLAFAVEDWDLPLDMAEAAAMEALPLCRGLAGLRPIERPAWSFDSLKHRKAGGARRAAERAWASAARSVGAGQKPLSLRTTDHTDEEFLQLTLRRVLRDPGQVEAVPEHEDAERLPWSVVEDPYAAMSGLLTVAIDHDPPAGEYLTTTVLAAKFPRLQIEFFPTDIELAHPKLFEEGVSTRATEDSLDLVAGGDVVSGWRYWYSDWEPTHPREISAYWGRLTSIDGRRLTNHARRSGMEMAVLCHAVYGHRRYAYGDAEVERESFWLS